MAIVNFIREQVRFMEYAADENLTPNEQALWHALFHLCNARREGENWPEDFILIKNDRLFTYCNMGFDAMARARNRLKQRGLIDFRNGEKNKTAPMYKLNYFYPEPYPLKTDNIGDKNGDGSFYPAGYPLKPDNIGDNMGDNMGDNIGDNIGDNMGDKYQNKENTENKYNIYTHRNNREGASARAGAGLAGSQQQGREETYLNEDGEETPTRFDRAYLTSKRARAAIAQRILNGFRGSTDAPNAHETLCELMTDGVPPELAEDVVSGANSLSRALAKLNTLCVRRGYDQEKEDREREKNLRIMGWDEKAAAALWRVSHPEEEQEAAEG